MKRLTLLRHAKSSWKDPDLEDFDRPLNHRGEHDAPMMGRRLLARGARPSLILTSKALRARQTARIIAREIGYPLEFLQGESDLYLADPEQILAVVARQDNAFNDIIVCGHNPGMTELAVQLTGADIDNVPTCGIVAMQTPVRDWTELRGSRCELTCFDYPRRRGEIETE